MWAKLVEVITRLL